jgi:hypothetical protein
MSDPALDKVLSARYRVHPRTIRRWRNEARIDPENIEEVARYVTKYEEYYVYQPETLEAVRDLLAAHAEKQKGGPSC